MVFGVSMHPKLSIALNEFLEFAQNLKVDAVDLRLDFPEFLEAFQSRKRVFEINELLSQFSLKRFVHAPIIDISLPSLNPILQRTSEEAMIDAIEFAGEIDAAAVVSHVGRLSGDYPPKYLHRATKNAVRSLCRINERCSQLGLMFTVENDCKTKDHVLAGTIEQIQHILEEVGCKMTLDVGHANTFGEPNEYFEEFQDYIVYMHMHDNHGGKDEHLPMGQGTIDFKAFFDAVGSRVSSLPMTTECHTLFELVEGTNVLRQKLKVNSALNNVNNLSAITK